MLLVFPACESNETYFPSYSGIYDLVPESIQYSGYGSNPAQRQDNSTFPVNIKLPNKIGAYMHPLQRRNGQNQHKITVLSLEPEQIKGRFFQAVFDYNGEYKKPLSERYDWQDTDSVYLGIDTGHACQYEYGTTLTITADPSPSTLDAAYPECTPKQVGDQKLCITELDWTKMEVKDVGWQDIDIFINIKFYAYKTLKSGFGQLCPKDRTHEYFSAMYASYVRSQDIDLGDPRTRYIHEVEQQIVQAQQGLSSILHEVFPVPTSGPSIRDLFPREKK